MNLQEMIARQRELTEAARQQGRSLMAEEQREFDSLQEQIDSMTASGQEGQRGANPPAGNPPASGEAAPGGDEARAAAMAERQRVRDITDLCQRFGMDSEPYISNDSTLDQVRAAVIEHLQRTKGPVGTRVTEDEGDKKRNAMTDGILLRQGIHVENPAPGANDFRNATLQMIAANCLTQEDSQRNYYMESGDEVYSALLQRAYYNPSSAFPAIMDNVIRKSYVEGHKTAPVTFEQFTTRGTLTDFKKADNYYVQGGFGQFLEVPENGELKHTLPTDEKKPQRQLKTYGRQFTMSRDNYYVQGGFGQFLEVPENGELKHTLPTDEKKPQRQLKTYGRQFTMSRQAFINDDMGVITTLPNRAAKAARMTINSQVYQILTGNPKIYDGKTLFVSDHGQDDNQQPGLPDSDRKSENL